MRTINSFIVLALFAVSFIKVSAQQSVHTNEHLDKMQQSIIIISSLTAKGDLVQLEKSLHDGLDAGLTGSAQGTKSERNY
jgi:4-carboxymuconolactone decarboxylase